LVLPCLVDCDLRKRLARKDMLFTTDSTFLD
jgi:hypothetical protein